MCDPKQAHVHFYPPSSNHSINEDTPLDLNRIKMQNIILRDYFKLNISDQDITNNQTMDLFYNSSSKYFDKINGRLSHEYCIGYEEQRSMMNWTAYISITFILLELVCMVIYRHNLAIQDEINEGRSWTGNKCEKIFCGINLKTGFDKLVSILWLVLKILISPIVCISTRIYTRDKIREKKPRAKNYTKFICRKLLFSSLALEILSQLLDITYVLNLDTYIPNMRDCQNYHMAKHLTRGPVSKNEMTSVPM